MWRTTCTVNSFFKIPIPCNESDTCNLQTESQLTADQKNINSIIEDEFLMCPRYWIDEVDCTMQDLDWSGLPSAVKAVVCSGDFQPFLTWCQSQLTRVDRWCDRQDVATLQAVLHFKALRKYAIDSAAKRLESWCWRTLFFQFPYCTWRRMHFK